LKAEDAELSGNGINTEEREGRTNLGFWDNPSDFAAWKVKFSNAGAFKVSAVVATVNAGGLLVLEAQGKAVAAEVPQTGDWARFTTFDLGTLQVSEGGVHVVKLRPKDSASWKAINVREIRMIRQNP